MKYKATVKVILAPIKIEEGNYIAKTKLSQTYMVLFLIKGIHKHVNSSSNCVYMLGLWVFFFTFICSSLFFYYGYELCMNFFNLL
jgi:hypothetical protein